jgi:hypothetical protein
MLPRLFMSLQLPRLILLATVRMPRSAQQEPVSYTPTFRKGSAGACSSMSAMQVCCRQCSTADLNASLRTSSTPESKVQRTTT